MPRPLMRTLGGADSTAGIRRLLPWLAVLATVAILAALFVGYVRTQPTRDRTRVYRIGYGRDVPFHFRGPDGQPTGLAVELVRESARRRGIQLEWIEADRLAADRLDLWVLMTVRPERRTNIHLTEPFLQTHTCFLVPEKSPIQTPEDLRDARISYLDFSIHRRNVTRLAPAMRPLPKQSADDVLRAVASGDADAAYLDEYAALPALLKGAAGAMPMRTIPAQLPKSEMGLASAPPHAAVADEIREEMHAMAQDGSLMRIVERWGFFPNLTTDQITGVAEIRRRVRWLTFGVATMSVLLGIVAGLAVRSRRQAIRLTHMQDQLRISEAQLRQAQKMEAVGQLAGGVAHDFNNILASTLLNVDLLQSTPNLDPEIRNGLKDIEASAQKAARLTRQLLMFSRRSVLEIRPLDLNERVDGMLRMLRRLLGEHIRLTFEPGIPPPVVEADAGLIEQVLVNLVVNARDAMPEGGSIQITTGTRSFDDSACSANPSRRPGRFAYICVADSGSGISEATLAHLFEPFFTTKPPGKGTGLGLATVHGIVTQHRGWVEVESKLNHGSRFTFFLPTADTATVPTVAPLEEEVPRGHETLLAVEDDAEVRRPLVQMLRELGYQVLEAGNGPDALTLWRHHAGRVDLLLTDMVMPEGMSGRTLAERLRADRPNLPVIISSGFSGETHPTGHRAPDGFTYLPKPYSKAQLARCLRDVLERRNRTDL